MRKQLVFLFLVATLGLAGCGKGTDSTADATNQTMAQDQSSVSQTSDMSGNTMAPQSPTSGNEATTTTTTTTTTSDAGTGTSNDTNIDQE